MQNYIEKLDDLKEKENYRSIKNIEKRISKYIIQDNKKMLNLSSNDYLNISTNKDLTTEFIDKYKKSDEFLFSSASARLLTGNSKSYNILEDDFFVLPSSVHEVVIVPASAGIPCSEMDAMVREINETQVAAEEVLGDSAYFYDRGSGTLQLDTCQRREAQIG